MWVCACERELWLFSYLPQKAKRGLQISTVCAMLSRSLRVITIWLICARDHLVSWNCNNIVQTSAFGSFFLFWAFSYVYNFCSFVVHVWFISFVRSKGCCCFVLRFFVPLWCYLTHTSTRSKCMSHISISTHFNIRLCGVRFSRRQIHKYTHWKWCMQWTTLCIQHSRMTCTIIRRRKAKAKARASIYNRMTARNLRHTKIQWRKKCLYENNNSNASQSNTNNKIVGFRVYRFA